MRLSLAKMFRFPHLPNPEPELRDLHIHKSHACTDQPMLTLAIPLRLCPPQLLFRCAQHLHLLFSWHPGQREFPVSYVRELLSSAPDVVAWGSGSPYFSLQGYSTAVYGSFEGLLLQVSRAHFGGCWRVERRQHGAGEEAVLAVRTYGRCASMGAASMGARVGGGGGGRGSGRWSQLSSRASSSKSLPVTAPATAEAEADGF